eukprot:4050204-Alexandrium_andersonii.AAC.1
MCIRDSFRTSSPTLPLRAHRAPVNSEPGSGRRASATPERASRTHARRRECGAAANRSQGQP